MFGVSTRTYEGDRVFYFCSFFLCIWIAYLVSIAGNRAWRLSAAFLITGYFLLFFYQSVLTWRISGHLAEDVVKHIRAVHHAGSTMYLINIPEEYNGAQVLRNGFTEMLLINHLDTAGIRAINYLTTENASRLPGTIKPANKLSKLYIYPAALINKDSIVAQIHTTAGAQDSVFVQYHTSDKIYYWNKELWVLLNNPF